MTERWPFGNPTELAEWATGVLRARGVDELADWTMVEYWMQMELYRAIRNMEKKRSWKYFGPAHCHYEQPYVTKYPRLGKPGSCKWADLIVTRQEGAAQEIVWIELKDLGRSAHRLLKNVAEVGKDLAALGGLEVEKTSSVWAKSKEYPAVKNKIQEQFWYENAAVIGRPTTHHRMAQVILCPQKLVDPDKVVDKWREAYRDRLKKYKVEEKDIPEIEEIRWMKTEQFIVLATVFRFPRQGGPG